MSEPHAVSLRTKLEGLENMPTIPVVLAPLLRYLEQPVDDLEVPQVVELISQDESLAAQCLHMANSPLYGRWQSVDSVRSAVVALGLQRMRDIAVSCSVLTLIPTSQGSLDPRIFWEHSLGCALVSQQFARRVGFVDSAKAYLGGLLHDIGVVACLAVVPQEYREALLLAQNERIPLHEAEMKTLGLTHCDAGEIVAKRWHFAPDLVAVAGYHHTPHSAPNTRDLVALISLSDLLCRMSGLGHGSVEDREVSFAAEPGFAILVEEYPALKKFDWARFTFELEAYMEEVHKLVALLYGRSK
jgi:HD-like signal output (HDOD) protein